MEKKALGKVELPQQEYDTVMLLAQEGLASRNTIAGFKQEVSCLRDRYVALSEKFSALLLETKGYREAMKLAPELLTAKIREILQIYKEKK